MKATNVVQLKKIPDTELSYELVSRPIFKDPKTQAGKAFTKTSAKGYLKVVKTDLRLALIDNISYEHLNDEDNLLEVVYLNGVITTKTQLSEIRDHVKSYL